MEIYPVTAWKAKVLFYFHFETAQELWKCVFDAHYIKMASLSFSRGKNKI